MDELTSKERELALKEREVVAREREIALKAEELKRSRWLNPVVLGLFAATAGLIGNIIIARVNNDNTQAVERLRLQSNLIVEAIKTDPKSACTNLTFLVGLGFIDDGQKAIQTACNASSPQTRPSIQLTTSNDLRGIVLNEERSPIAGAKVTVVGLGNEDITDMAGQFYLRMPPSTRNVVILHVERKGYRTENITVYPGSNALNIILVKER
jgi:hypothetical protein